MSRGGGVHFTFLSLRGRRQRLALGVVSLAVAVAVTCAIDSISRAVEHAFGSVIAGAAGRTTLLVEAEGGGLFSELVVHKISSLPGVEAAVPILIGTAFEPSSAEPLTVYGFDVAVERFLNVYEPGKIVRAGDMIEYMEAGDAVFVPRAFADHRGLGIGDTVALDTPRGRRVLTVRRIFELEGIGRVFGGNVIVMDRALAQPLFGQPGFVNRIDVVVRIEEDLARARDAIAAALPQGLEITTPLERSMDLRRVVRSFQILLWSAACVAVVLCSLVAYSALATHFEAQAWETAVMRAVGVRQVRAWWELMKQSLLLGAAGVVVGMPLSVLLAKSLLPTVSATAAVNYRFTVRAAALGMTPSSFALGAVVGLSAAILTAVLPAWRATRVSIDASLRRRGRELRLTGSRKVHSRALAAALAALALMLASRFVVRSPASTLAATGLVVVVTALAAQPLLRVLAPLMARGSERFAGPTGLFASASLLGNARRTALAVAVLGVGIGCIVWVRTVATSFEQTLVESLGGTLRAELVVASTRVVSGWVPAPLEPAVLDALTSVPGVLAVAGNRLADTVYRDTPIAINAFDPRYFENPEFGQPRLLGAHVPSVWDEVASGRGVIVSTNFLLNFDAHVGDVIRLDTPSGRLDVPIVGATIAFVSPAGTIEMSRALYERHWNDHHVNRVWVRADRGADLRALREAIARHVGPTYGAQVFTSGEMLDYLASQARRAFAPIVVIEAIVLLVVLIGVGDALASAVLQRTWEIGTMRAVGVRSRDVAQMVFTESVMLATPGLVLALAAGLVLATMWVHATLPDLLGWLLELHVPWARLALVALPTFAVCLGAAILPARAATRLEVKESLRYE